MKNLRSKLVSNALKWEKAFGNSPAITSVLSELDAALLVGCSMKQYSANMQGTTAVQPGHDFIFNGARYQVKGNRPSGKPGSFVTLVPKAKNYNWDFLVWVLYNQQYEIQEAWLWDVKTYRAAFHLIKRLSPAHYRQGTKLYIPPNKVLCTCLYKLNLIRALIPISNFIKRLKEKILC